MKTLMTMVAVAGLALVSMGCGDAPAAKPPAGGGKETQASKINSMQPSQEKIEQMKKDGGIDDAKPDGDKAAEGDKADDGDKDAGGDKKEE